MNKEREHEIKLAEAQALNMWFDDLFERVSVKCDDVISRESKAHTYKERKEAVIDALIAAYLQNRTDESIEVQKIIKKLRSALEGIAADYGFPT